MLELGVYSGDSNLLEQRYYPNYIFDYMFPFPSPYPWPGFYLSNALCLLRTRKDILVIIDSGQEDGKNVTKAFQLKNNAVSISLLKGKLELC